jgi:hypothetical protein
MGANINELASYLVSSMHHATATHLADLGV